MITVETQRKVIMEKSYWLKKLCWQTKDNVTECLTLNNVDSHSENRAFSYNHLMNNDGLQQKNKTQTNLKDLVLRERLVGQNIRQHYIFQAHKNSWINRNSKRKKFSCDNGNNTSFYATSFDVYCFTQSKELIISKTYFGG